MIVVGVEGALPLAVWAYTIGFGVLLLAGLLLIILGFVVLDSPLVVIVSTIIPLTLSLGLIWEYASAWHVLYLAFVVLGLTAVTLTRLKMPGKAATVTLAVVHGIVGLLIFGLPILLSLQGQMPPGFALVGVGGLLLSFLKMGKPILPQKTILTVLPALLLLMTAAFAFT